MYAKPDTTVEDVNKCINEHFNPFMMKMEERLSDNRGN